MEERLIKVGITHGDINGIGYEVILKTFRYPHGGALHADYLWLVQDSRLSPEGIELPPINMNIISHAEDAE